MLKTRIINGIIAATILLSAIFFSPNWLYLIILATVCTLTILEFCSLLDGANVPNSRGMAIAGAIILNLAVWIECRYQFGYNLELLALFLILGAMFVLQMTKKSNARIFENIGSTLFAILYVGFLFSFMTRLLIYDGSFSGRWPLFYLLAMIKISDSGAFFAGTYLGRHKMAPRISPKKTWEGFFGGVAAGLAASLAIYFGLQGDFGVFQMQLGDAVALGILLPSVGTLGDLSESMLKRAADKKDSSTNMKGLGGMLDLADSVLPSIPILYFWAIFFIK